MSTPLLYSYYLEILEVMYGGIAEHRNPTPILSALTVLAKYSTEFLDLLSSKFAENHFSSIIQTFLMTKQEIPNVKCALHSCPRHSTRKRITSHISLCEFILHLGFLTKSCLEHSTLVLALEKLTQLSSLTSLLDCTPITHKPSLPVILEEVATPFPQRDSHSWKENLANDLIRDAHSKYDNILNTIGFVCRDLEQRCTTIESPLRKAEQEINGLKECIEILTREKLNLEESCSVLNQELGEVRNQKESLAHELRCVRAEVAGCQGGLRNAAAEKEQMVMEIEKERRSWKEREEELMTTNRVLDDDLQETQANVKGLEEKVL